MKKSILVFYVIFVLVIIFVGSSVCSNDYTYTKSYPSMFLLPTSSKSSVLSSKLTSSTTAENNSIFVPYSYLSYPTVIISSPNLSSSLSSSDSTSITSRSSYISSISSFVSSSNFTSSNLLSSSYIINEIKLISLTSPISQGYNATITIKGAPNVTYNITVYYSSRPSTANGLYPKTSDSDGYVSWTWKVGTRTYSGTYEILISDGSTEQSFYFTVS